MEQYTPLMKAVIELEDFLIKARKMPIGTVSKGRKKIAEGKWVKVKGEIKKVQEKPKSQTETPEFKAWFGNSKVVDSSGKPLVVYHGTNKDFKEFSKERINSSGKTAYNTFGHGFYFTNVPEIASGYSSERKNSNIIPVFLSIKNPYIVKSSNKDEIDNLRASGKNSQYIEELKDKNYDGIFVINDRISSKALNKYGKQPIEFIAFSPTQIKSATGNQGTFDPNNPDMTKARI